MITLTAVSANEKVFRTGTPRPLTTPVYLFPGEQAHLQIAISSENERYMNLSLRFSGGAVARAIEGKLVGFVPALCAYDRFASPKMDDYNDFREDRLYPDPLEPISLKSFPFGGLCNQTFFLTVKDSDKIEVGEHTVTVRLYNNDTGKTVVKTSFTLIKMKNPLPEQKCISTAWMHYDCIAAQHHVKLFGNDFYRVFESYLEKARYTGQNMLLVPIITPEFDTAIGGERTTAQLLDIRETADGGYTFDFTALGKFLDFILARGIKYLEIPPLFTQWGALNAPKILVRGQNGRLRRRFGWETDSLSDEYRAFLQAMVPALVSYLRERGLEESTFFHISDEPSLQHKERYFACKELVMPLIGNCRTLDACGDLEFAGKTPREYSVCIESGLQPYLDAGIRPLCTYYCCAPIDGYYPNRLLTNPLARVAVLGPMLYRYDIDLFLHWGFNFYNTYLSRRSITPFNNTDADCVYPNGDGFIVYPDYAGFGALHSLRSIAMHEAFRLSRMLYCLDALIGREACEQFLAEEGILSFCEYPRTPGWIDTFTDHLARRLAAAE